jgi:nucleotide-binding universal stress UspA family protein
MKILLAVDGSSHSQDAVDAVARRPWPPGTVVRVLSVVQQIPPPSTELVLGAAESLGQIWAERKAQAQRLTARVADSLNATALRTETAVREGDARSGIIDEATEWGADLIVLGSHGHTGLKRWLLGSIAQSIVSHAPCSVEVVRRPES